MTLGLALYKLATLAISPFLGLVLRRRVRAGKENPSRLNERRAKQLKGRGLGGMVWLHGASVGESLVLIGVADEIGAVRPDVSFVFTSQTQTSARIVAAQAPPNSVHQMAPIDTRAISERFIQYWKPDLVMIAEGEIWPNMIETVSKHDIPLALVNARMTEKSIGGWMRWRATAKRLFSRFDVILPADSRTAEAISRFIDRDIAPAGNLKAALAPPPSSDADLKGLANTFGSDRQCLLAASTHPSEEAFILDTWAKLSPKPALIIAPRHPERGDEIEALVRARGFSVARRSKGTAMSEHTDILLADTLGEMGLWYQLADAVYLGGAHAEGIGGHNPIEPLRYGKAVISGPHAFNFVDVFAALEPSGALRVVDGEDKLKSVLAEALTTGLEIDQAVFDRYFEAAHAPMEKTLKAILPLLPDAKL